jgi:hypothetical protein
VSKRVADDTLQVARTLRAQVDDSRAASKRLKVSTLLRKFGYQRRSDSNTAEITATLDEVGVSIVPSILRFGDEWGLSTEDWVYLSSEEGRVTVSQEEEVAGSGSSDHELPPEWNADGWFDRIVSKQLRTEKEVEIKFIVPLLSKLGYSEDDRYDGMPVPAAHGSKKTTLVIDFALFNAELESLRHQPLLTVEAKREHRLVKAKEIESAHNQAKSYCLWTGCDFFVVTDSQLLQVFDLTRRGLQETALKLAFSCERAELKEGFPRLYNLISKEALTRHYLARLATTEEAF